MTECTYTMVFIFFISHSMEKTCEGLAWWCGTPSARASGQMQMLMFSNVARLITIFRLSFLFYFKWCSWGVQVILSYKNKKTWWHRRPQPRRTTPTSSKLQPLLFWFIKVDNIFSTYWTFCWLHLHIYSLCFLKYITYIILLFHSLIGQYYKMYVAAIGRIKI